MNKTVGALILALAAASPIAAVDPKLVELVREIERFPADKGSGTEAERLHRLYDLAWSFEIQSSPELATFLGIPGSNDKWSDGSFEAIEFGEAAVVKLMKAAQSIDRTALPEAERVHYDLFSRRLASRAEALRFPGELMPITQIGGVQQHLAQVLVDAPAQTVKDYEDLVARLRGIPQVVDDTIARLDRGLARGITPPRVTLREVPDQVKNLIFEDAQESPLLDAFRRFPDAVAAADRERLTAAATAAYTEWAAPALARLHVYLRDTYVPKARTTIAARDLPGGEEWYAHQVRQFTTTDLTPRQIHEIGLAEVRRIRGEMEKVIAASGFTGSFAEFLDFLRTDSRFFFDQPEDLLAAYRDIAKRADPELAKLFGRLPRLPYGVKAVPAYMEKAQTAAYYESGSLKAGRGGYFVANTYNLKARPKWAMEALTLHEAVPGHHLQISIAQELEGIPEWRKYDGYTAFIEGWGLYAESLGTEMGFFQDPYSKFGQLTSEIWRALRLVVDTGLHSFGWTREQAIDYLRQNSGRPEHHILVEVDRYIVLPGQALAYKLGELKIKELRAYAAKELGPRFDIRAFHDQVLGNGALPLDLLESNVKAWVEIARGTRHSAVGRRPRAAHLRLGHDDGHRNVVRLVGERVEQLRRVGEPDGGKRAAREESVEVAAAVPEAEAAPVEGQPEHQHGLHCAVDRALRHFGSPARWLPQAEGERVERAGVRVDVEPTVSGIGPRHEERPALGEQALHEAPGIDLRPERQTSEDPFGACDLRQREHAFGDAIRRRDGDRGIDLAEPRTKPLAQRCLGYRDVRRHRFLLAVGILAP